MNFGKKNTVGLLLLLLGTMCSFTPVTGANISFTAVVKEKTDLGSGRTNGWMPVACTEKYAEFCVHGQCEMNFNAVSCR